MVIAVPSSESEALRKYFEDKRQLFADNPDVSFAVRRALIEDIHECTAEPTDVTYAEVEIDSRDGLWCLPRAARPDKVILYLHGGGFALQSIHSHRKLAGHLAKAARSRVALIDYRRTPEHVFPSQIEDTITGYDWLLGQGYAGRDIAICGDSAGGGLAVMASVWLRDSLRELPAAVCAFSPWVDLECAGESMRTNAHLDAFIAQELAQQLTALYLGPTGSPTDPKANALYANLEVLPPTFLAVGGHEALLSDAERLADRLTNAGVDVSFDVWPAQQHVHAFMAGRAAEADDVINAAAAWIGNHWNAR
jgi:monoterpene epsilon-lactone hydrolase